MRHVECQINSVYNVLERSGFCDDKGKVLKAVEEKRLIIKKGRKQLISHENLEQLIKYFGVNDVSLPPVMQQVVDRLSRGYNHPPCYGKNSGNYSI